ncbi:MAG: methyltransferase domain-containing protein [Chloroflexota bacterium]
MADDKTLAAHYAQGRLVASIEAAIAKLGKTPDTITLDDLSVVDAFHVGGQPATEHLLAQLNLNEQAHLVEVGCGIGGGARFAVHTYGCRVTGVDLTPEYVEAGNVISRWIGLDHRIELHQGNALSMPFPDAGAGRHPNSGFDGGFLMHIGMNIADKAALFTEISRVLRPGSRFGVYDIMHIGDGALTYPVPWASEPSMSHLASPKQYQQAMIEAGFIVSAVNNRRAFALASFEQRRKQVAENASPSPLGIHLLMGDTVSAKVRNMMSAIQSGHVAPVEIIIQKQS